MFQWIRLVVATSVVIGLTANAALAVSIRDLIKLKAAGLGDDVLIALIESDGSVFNLGADDVLSLKDQGLGEKLIIAMLRTARKAPPRPSLPAAEMPPPDVVLPPAPSDETQQVAQVAPVVVNVQQTVEQHVEQPRVETRTVHVPVPIAVPVFVRHRQSEKATPAPVYWGFGGQRRPDTWQEKKN